MAMAKPLLSKYELCLKVKIKVLAHFLFLRSNGGTHGNNSFASEKHRYLPYFFKNIVVNWTLSSLDEGSLEITVSVPVNNLLHFTIFYLTISEIKMINTIIQYLK